MKLYVANCTRQVQDFIYRLPEHTAPMRQRIDIGHQVALSGDLSQPDIDAVIKAHTRYGMVAASEVDHTKAFIGTCYSVDKPVKIGTIQFALQHNNDVLILKGREMRQEAAVAINNALDESTGGGSLSEVEISVVEEKGANGESPIFGEGVIVSKDVTPGDNGKATTRGQRAARKRT